MTTTSAAPGQPDFDLDSWLAKAPALPPILQSGAVVLRRRARPVPPELLGSRALDDLVGRMIEVMRKAPGVGLAAPQIGVPLRVFVAEDPEERVSEVPAERRKLRGRVVLPLTVLVNPSLDSGSVDQATFFEGCLSVRGYAALVPRWRAVSISGVDARGAAVALRLEGWPARIVQHELDHLDGTLYVDRMLSRSLTSEAELGRLSALPVSEVLRELVEAPVE